MHPYCQTLVDKMLSIDHQIFKHLDQLPQDQILPMKTRLSHTFSFILVAGLAYLFINHFPIFEPKVLSYLPFEADIPFLAWTVYPYLWLLSCDLILPCLISNRDLFRIAIRGIGIASIYSCMVWLLYPTTYPRPTLADLPINGFLDTVSMPVYTFLIVLDAPTNCFPSGHVTMPTVLFWTLSKQNPNKTILYASTLLMLTLSILTTKQHYIWDILGAFCCASLAIYSSLKVEKMRGHDYPLQRN